MPLSWLADSLRSRVLPRQRALVVELRQAIHSGRIIAGARLPASRQLAADLGVARNTVLYAYDQLAAEGYLVADRHGTRVASLPVPTVAPAGGLPPLSRRAEAMPHSPSVEDGSAMPFALGGVALDLFPPPRLAGCHRPGVATSQFPSTGVCRSRWVHGLA